MKCPNCGAELEKGKLYCSVCGNEIQMVPDFEPEIENSIAQTLITVAQDAALSDLDKKPEEESSESVKGISKRKKILIYGVITGAVLGLVCVFFLLLGLYRSNSANSQIKKAQDAFDKKNYVEAAVYYENALLMDENETDTRISLAECYMNMGETQKAIEEYLTVINLDEHNEIAYAQLIAIYEQQGDYNSINNLLLACIDEKIQYEFQSYMAKEPEFNYKGGTYDQVIPLKLIAPSFGKIYYTLDESNPGKGSLIYTAPIFLRKGSYTVSAVYINDYGIASQIVRNSYIIQSQTPETPTVDPLSGTYDLPQLITVDVPEDCNVYYTTDGSAPGENSSIYGEPIPMMTGDSTYKFIAISQDGVQGDVVEVTYQLNIETKLTQQTAINTLRYRLVEVNRLLDAEGNLENMSGKNIYVFNSLRYIDDKILYFIYEYYQEGNLSRNMTGNIFAVDAQEGRVYKAIKGENGEYTLEAI